MNVAEKLVHAGSPFELITVRVNGEPRRVFRHAPACLNDLYRRAAASTGHACLNVSGEEISYGRLLHEAGSLAQHLRNRLGIGPGTRVAIVLPSGAQWYAAFIAITSMGASAVLLDHRLGAVALREAIGETSARYVIADETLGRRFAATAASSCEIITTPASRDSSSAYFDGTAAPPDSFLLHGCALDPDTEALVSFTSGSTSRPKAAACSHRAVIAGLMTMSLGSSLAAARMPRRRGVDVARRPVSLLLSPFAHVSGYMHLLLMMQVAGKVVVPASEQCPQQVLDLIEQHKVTALSGVGARTLSELLCGNLAARNLSSLTRVGLYGVALRAQDLKEIQTGLPGVELSTGYGLTETNGSISLAGSADFAMRPETAGLVVPSVELRVVDEGGQELPHRCFGSLEVRGAMVMSGYCDASLNARALHNGWFRTGDVGAIDPEGFLTLRTQRSRTLELRKQDRLTPRIRAEGD